ncbi:hypothetical protein M422DRAFT_242546 [Sphaerobolus stellatus SS14]|nr:hypothetical protein M422DRAFT_242546 [Sphaerobolus stellatus SS14]
MRRYESERRLADANRSIHIAHCDACALRVQFMWDRHAKSNNGTITTGTKVLAAEPVLVRRFAIKIQAASREGICELGINKQDPYQILQIIQLLVSIWSLLKLHSSRLADLNIWYAWDPGGTVALLRHPHTQETHVLICHGKFLSITGLV